MPNINCGSIARQMYDECRKVREGFSLDWDNCVTYSSDNTNSMTGQRNNLLEKVTKRWPKDFWCWLPLLFSTFVWWKESQRTFCKGSGFFYWHMLSVSQECKTKNQLREFMNFNNNEVRKWRLYKVVTSWKTFRENIDAMGLFRIIFLV